jgi:hypothetical protein
MVIRQELPVPIEYPGARLLLLQGQLGVPFELKRTVAWAPYFWIT